jgi:hypothetical protein
MTEIAGVMQKISLSTEYTAEMFIDKANLLATELPISDDILIDYIEKLQEIINYATEVSNNAPTHYFFDSMSSDSIYILIDFKDLDQWNSVLNSDHMIDYQVIKQQVYENLGWIDHGYKIIEDYELIDPAAFKESLIDGKAGAEIIWNSVA